MFPTFADRQLYCSNLADHMTQAFQADIYNCGKTIETKEGHFISLVPVCLGLSQEESDRQNTVFATTSIMVNTLLAMHQTNHDSMLIEDRWVRMGMCKLNANEQGELLDWMLSFAKK